MERSFVGWLEDIRCPIKKKKKKNNGTKHSIEQTFIINLPILITMTTPNRAEPSYSEQSHTNGALCGVVCEASENYEKQK